MRLLVECNHIYDHPRHHSGIQRVVRNILSGLSNIHKNTDTIPVILKYNKVYEVKRMIPDNYRMYLSNYLLYLLIRARELYLSYCKRSERVWPFCASSFLRRGLLLLLKIGDFPFHFFILVFSCLCRRGEVGRRIVELAVKSDDVLILLDASWHQDFLDQVEAQKKAKGIGIVSVVYDVIPLSHPQFCTDRLVSVFQHWLKWASQISDGFMAISETTRNQVQVYALRGDAENKPQRQWFDYFHLGSELELSEKNGAVRDHVQKIFQSNDPVYLMVGTIEPRKNHGYLLDAFDLLWRSGLKIKLCFVGKAGWRCEAILRRIRNHSEYNRRLFMFNDLSDTELDYCYRKSRSLVLPAFAEGFGLPLVEAMQRGLPAMASDIPVFREVGGDFVAYFELEKPETLAALIRQNKAGGVFPASKPLRDWSWLNWEDSAKQFLTRIVSHVTTSRGGINQKSQDELKNNHE
jgi:alpha-1,2-rhamnosyltransferase